MPLLSQLGKVWEVMLLGGHKGPESQPGDAFWLLSPTVYPPAVTCAVADGLAIIFNSINKPAKPKFCLQNMNDIQPLPVSILRICRSVDSTFGTNGTTKFTASGNARIESVYRLSNGKFLCTNALFMVQFLSLIHI